MPDMRTGPKLLIAAVCSLGLTTLASAASVVKHLQLERGIEAVHFSADGGTFAMLSRDELRFWKIGTGEIAHEKLSPNYGSFSRSRTIANERFMLVAVDGLRLYDLANGELVARLGSGLVKSFAYDPVSQHAAVLLQRQEVAEAHHYYGSSQIIHTYPTTIAVFDLADELATSEPSRLGVDGSDVIAFHLSTFDRNVDAVRWLLARGVDPNAKRVLWACNLTALHVCAEHGIANVARVLLDAGADPTIEDDRYAADVLSWAMFCRQVEIAALVMEARR